MKPFKNLPQHVAIIMDGNRRWAKSHNLSFEVAYITATSSIKEAVTEAINFKIPYLTLFALSSENKKRPESELIILKKLIKKYLEEEEESLIENKIKLNVLGNYKDFSKSLAIMLDNIIEKTKNFNNLNLNIALNYSGKNDIINAINNLIKNKDIKKNIITENDINNALYTKNIPNPDIIIRTGNEVRLSNFFLWQAAYSELFFLNIMWPDFKKENFIKVLEEFQTRERRYGK